MPRQKIQKEIKDCFYCKDQKNPDFLEVELLEKFITERGKIQPRERSGICSTHQRKLSTAIKRARHLALLPFIVRPE